MKTPRQRGNPAKHLDPSTHRRDGSPRSRKPKATHTLARFGYTLHLWRPVALALRKYLHANHGAQTRMARALGITDSQLHRFACGECEHDQEPTFGIGMAILLYLGARNAGPILHAQTLSVERVLPVNPWQQVYESRMRF